MPILIGIILALGIAAGAHLAGFDRDRSFYPTILVIVASYYDLFGVMGGSMHALVIESGFVIGFLLLAYLAFRFSAWLAVAGLAAHGIFDFFHGHVLANPGVPIWWPHFCMAYDITAAAFLAGLLLRNRRRTSVRDDMPLYKTHS